MPLLSEWIKNHLLKYFSFNFFQVSVQVFNWNFNHRCKLATHQTAFIDRRPNEYFILKSLLFVSMRVISANQYAFTIKATAPFDSHIGWLTETFSNARNSNKHQLNNWVLKRYMTFKCLNLSLWSTWLLIYSLLIAFYYTCR